MNPSFTVLLAINNFLHDLATAVPLASGVAMWAILRQCEKNRSDETDALMLGMYKGISKIFIVSLVWITLGAIPRILTFTRFEWAGASGSHNVTGLIEKHMTIFAVLMAGSFLWITVIRRVKKLTGFSG